MKCTYDGRPYNLTVIDDGTLDTVISVNGKEFRFDSDAARNDDGSIPERTFTDAIEAYLEEKTDTKISMCNHELFEDGTYPVVSCPTNSQTHTPTPWEVDTDSTGRVHISIDGRWEIFVSDPQNLGVSATREKAAHIVKCVNAHDELVDALRKVNMILSDGGDPRQAIFIASKALCSIEGVH